MRPRKLQGNPHPPSAQKVGLVPPSFPDIFFGVEFVFSENDLELNH